MSSYNFLNIQSGRFWEVSNPVAWLLEHRHNPLLERARSRVHTLGPEEGDRVLRVVLRRCGLLLVRINDAQVVVHHWGQPPDLRQFFKKRLLVRPEVQIAFLNKKNGGIVIQPGTNFMYGEALGSNFPWQQYRRKFERRHAEEDGDEKGAWSSRTNFVWPDAEENRVPWRVLKAVWRSEQAISCPNCDGKPLVLLSFSWYRGPLSFRSAKVERACLRCRRCFTSDEEKPLVWLASVLESALRPTYLQWPWRRFEIVWDGVGPRLA